MQSCSKVAKKLVQNLFAADGVTRCIYSHFRQRGNKTSAYEFISSGRCGTNIKEGLAVFEFYFDQSSPFSGSIARCEQQQGLRAN